MPTFLPLQGVKILDLSRLLPGPFCTYLLNQLGAGVTCIYSPALPEVLSFPALRRGKKKLPFNLKNSRDLLKFKGLVKKSDVIVEGFRPGVMDRLGMGFSLLKKINPRIILCSLSGYGHKGGEVAGHDLNYLSLSGVLSVLAAGRDPMIPGIPLADLVAGMSSALKIAAALTVPKSKRKALHLDLSIHNAIRDFLTPLTPDVLKIVQPIFTGGLARYHLYQTRDQQWLAVAPLEEKFWRKFAQVMEIPSSILKEGEGDTVAWLESKFRGKTRKEWLRILSDPELCVTPVI